MCEKSSMLVIFLILKILILVILPIILCVLYKKEDKNFKIVGIINIVSLVILIILRIFNNNCVVYSTVEGIKKVSSTITDEMIYENSNANDTSKINIEPNTNYKTYKNNQLYYFNQYSASIKDSYYECNENKVYANTYANGITAFSIAVSTIHNKSITPVELFNSYKKSHDVCNDKISTDKIISHIKSIYNQFGVYEISSSQLEDEIKNGRIVVAELSANEDSNFTCDTGYIVIYNMDLNGKFMIANPALTSTDFVCPYSSNAYGRVIKSDNMNKSWSLSALNNEVIHYYSIYIAQDLSSIEKEMGHD